MIAEQAYRVFLMQDIPESLTCQDENLAMPFLGLSSAAIQLFDTDSGCL